METVDRCNLCGSRQQKPIEHYECYGRVLAFVECLQCGLAFLTPRPSAVEMAAYYGEEYAKAHHCTFQDPSFWRSLFAGIQRVWLRARYRPPALALASRVLFPPELAWRWIVRCNLLYGLPGIGRVLDVGCGNGGWLGQMRLYGFECYGCEPDPGRARTAASIGDLAISATGLHGGKYPDGYFDVVRIWHVLEHVHDPMAVLNEAGRVLRRGGLVVTSSPNHEGILARVYRNIEDVPRHLFSFSPRTISLYLEKTGFHLKHIRTGGDPWAIYGPFYEASMSYLRGNGSSEKERMAERFWASRLRRLEYRPTRQFFGRIGAGHCLFVSGIKT